MSPPSQWKYATTRSLVVTIIITTALMVGFVFLVGMVFTEENRPVSEKEQEQFWQNIEQIDAQKHKAGN